MNEQMSRQYEKTPDDGYTVVVDDMSRCKNMYDGVCCDDRSPWFGDYPDHGYNCRRCPWFEVEDGVIV